MKNIIFLSFFLCLIMACTKDGPPGPKGPDGPPYMWPPGNITGYINLRDQFGVSVTEKDSVWLQTFNADSIFRAYTDTNGYFNLSAVPPGNYDISVSKNGYDSLHLYIQHGGGVMDKFLGITSMAQHVSTKLVSFTARAQRSFPDVFVVFETVFKWPMPPRLSVSGFKVYVDTAPGPGEDRAIATYSGGFIQDIDGITGKMTGSLNIPMSLSPSGTTLYFTVVVAPVTTGYAPWLDYATGNQIAYPYVGDSLQTQTIYTE